MPNVSITNHQMYMQYILWINRLNLFSNKLSNPPLDIIENLFLCLSFLQLTHVSRPDIKDDVFCRMFFWGGGIEISADQLYVNLTQARVMGKEEASVEKMHPQHQAVGNPVKHFLNW